MHVAVTWTHVHLRGERAFFLLFLPLLLLVLLLQLLLLHVIAAIMVSVRHDEEQKHLFNYEILYGTHSIDTDSAFDDDIEDDSRDDADVDKGHTYC